MGSILLLVVLNSTVVVNTAFYLFLTGLICAPFAATICALTARHRGLNTRLYAVAGAIYSVLFILPFIYLILRTYGWQTKRNIVQIAYGVLHVYVWLAGVIVYDLWVMSISTGWIGIQLALLAANIVTLVVSMGTMYGNNHYNKEYVNQGVANQLPYLRYMIPFILLLVWVIISRIVSNFVL